MTLDADARSGAAHSGPQRETLRLFVAVRPPPEAVAHLGAVVDTLEVSRANAPGRSTRMASRELWHVTLAFLGEVPSAKVEAASGAVSAAAARVAATADGPIRLRVAGGGTFGRSKFRILWAALAGDIDALRGLATTVRRELRRARLPFDAKPLRPHLTIGRPGDRVERPRIAADVATLRTYMGPDWSVDAIELVASELGPTPRYTYLSQASLI